MARYVRNAEPHSSDPIVCRVRIFGRVVINLQFDWGNSTFAGKLTRLSCKQAISWLFFVLFCFSEAIAPRVEEEISESCKLERWNSGTWLFSPQLHNKLILKIYQISHFLSFIESFFFLWSSTTFKFYFCLLDSSTSNSRLNVDATNSAKFH